MSLFFWLYCSRIRHKLRWCVVCQSVFSSKLLEHSLALLSTREPSYLKRLALPLRGAQSLKISGKLFDIYLLTSMKIFLIEFL